MRGIRGALNWLSRRVRFHYVGILVDYGFTLGLPSVLMKPASPPIKVSFAGLTSAGRVPSWASHWHWETNRTTVDELCQADLLSGVVVVSVASAQVAASERTRLSALAAHVLRADRPVRVVLSFRKGGLNSDQLFETLKSFRGAASRVEVADGDDRLEPSLNEAVAKYRVEEEERSPDPLAEAQEVMALTESLLSDRGRLDAKAVAKALDIPWTRLAVLLGSNKQAVHKTPDAPSLQAALRPYERIARLRAVLPEKRFLAWLQQPNIHLDDHTPLQIIESERPEVVADLVEAMLTGTPG